MMRSRHGKMRGLLSVVSVSLLVFMLSVCAEAKDPASSAKKIKIGVAGPMKFSWGKNMWVGAQVAAEEINAHGGVVVKGVRYDIEAINADSNDYQSVVDAVNTVKRFITVDKINFLIAGARTEATLAQQEVMADYRVIYIFSGGGSPVMHTRLAENYERFKYFFNMVPNAIDQNRTYGALLDTAAAKIREDLGIAKPKVALVMEKAKWADAIVDAAKATLPKMGMEVVGEWRPSAMASDLTSELSAIKAAGAHIIYEVFTGPAAVIFNKQVGELQIPVAVVGVNTEGIGMGKRYWNETNGMCEFETAVGWDFGSVEITKKTAAVYNVLFNRIKEIPFMTAYTCYDAIYLLKEAAERAGSLESDAVVRELEKTDYAATFGRVAFHPKGHKWPHGTVWGAGYQTFIGFQWQAGKMVAVWPNGRSPHPALDAGSGWEGLKYKGTGDFKLAPRMIKYWKK